MGERRMTVITIKDQFDGSYTVKLRGGDQFGDIIEALKAVIPAPYRTYDPDARYWKIFEGHYLREWLAALEYFDDIKVEWASAKRQYQAPPRQPRYDSRESAFATLHLLPTAPPELVRCAHKTLALIHHPDRGGDLRTMQEINNAADVILKA